MQSKVRNRVRNLNHSNLFSLIILTSARCEALAFLEKRLGIIDKPKVTTVKTSARLLGSLPESDLTVFQQTSERAHACLKATLQQDYMLKRQAYLTKDVIHKLAAAIKT